MGDNSTTTSLLVIDELVQAFSDGQKIAFQTLWDLLMSFLFKNWLSVTVFLFIIFIVAFVRAMFGRWGMFGSVLYNYLYFGILFIVGLIFGPMIFANIFIDIVCVILYIVCFRFVRIILDDLGLRGNRKR